MESKMISLLSNKSQNIVDILQVISADNQWYSLKSISLEVNLSERSIQRYINELYDIIGDYNKEKENYFSLLLQKNQGVKLIINKEASIDFLVSYIMQKDETINLLLHLLFLDYHSTAEYIRKNSVGKYYLNQSYIKIDDLLYEYDLTIDKKNFKVIGSEINIRIFMYNVCWTIYRGDVWPERFGFVEHDIIKSDVCFIIESLNISVTNPLKIRNLMFVLAISIIRYRKKCKMIVPDELKKYIPNYGSSINRVLVEEVIREVLSRHYITDDNEAIFLVLDIITKDVMYTSSCIKTDFFEYHKKQRTDIYEATELFMSEFQKIIHEIPMEQMDRTFEFVFRCHLRSLLFPYICSDSDSYNLFNKNINEYYVNLNMIKQLIKTLREKSHLSLFRKEDYLAQQYAIVIFSLNLDLTYNLPIKIRLQTDLPDIYDIYVKRYITNYFKYKYKIVFIDDEYYLKPDFIISSIPSNDEDTVNITYPIGDRDLNKIECKLKTIEQVFN